MDKRAFGRKPAVAMHIVKTLRDFHCDPGKEARAFANAAKGTVKMDILLHLIRPMHSWVVVKVQGLDARATSFHAPHATHTHTHTHALTYTHFALFTPLAVRTQTAAIKQMSVLSEVHVPKSSPETPTSTRPEEPPLTSPKPPLTESPRPSSVASASQRPASTTHPEPPSHFPEPSASPGQSATDGAPSEPDGPPEVVLVVGILPKPAVDEVAIKMEDEALIVGADPDVTKDSDFDWWSKFYASIGDEQCRQPEYEEEGNDKMVVCDIFASVCSEGELNSFNIYDIDDLI